MPAERYDRFQIQRPRFLGDEHWECITVELGRLHRSLDADDDGQALSDIKCLVEATARVALDIAGEPAQPNDSYEKKHRAGPRPPRGSTWPRSCPGWRVH